MFSWRLVLFLVFVLCWAFQGEAQISVKPGLELDPAWLHLGHYEKTLWGYSSSARSQQFFLSKDGKTDPRAELEATYEVLFKSPERWARRCQFPARYRWLRNILSLDPTESDSLSECSDLKAWKKTLNAQGLTLVHPESSLESSVSVFSHTFLKVLSGNLDRDSRLNTSISFAASFRKNDNFLKLAFYGIFGGYDGKYGTGYFYDDVIRYGVKESRDIFEYDLNLNSDEIEQILNHIWEIKETNFDYLFLTRNCSYYLLRLLEIGRPSLNLSSSYSARTTIPIETVKTVFADKGLISNVHYSPSLHRMAQTQLKNLNEDSQNLYQLLKTDPLQIEKWPSLSQSIPASERGAVLDLLVQFLTNDDLASFNAQRRQALIFRTKETATPTWISPLPSHFPHEYHGSHLLGFYAGQRLQESGAMGLLRYRFVFHDVLNDSAGAVPNTTVEAFDLEGKVEDQNVDLYRLKLFHILSLKSVELSHSYSWLFRSELSPQLTNLGGLGYAWLREQFKIYGLVAGRAESVSWDKSYIYYGGLLGVIVGISDKWSLQIENSYYFDLAKKQNDQFIPEATINYRLKKNDELRLALEGPSSQSLLKFGYNHMF